MCSASINKSYINDICKDQKEKLHFNNVKKGPFKDDMLLRKG